MVANVFVAADEAKAQNPVLSVANPTPDSLGVVGPTVTTSGVLGDRRIRELLDHGFQARLRFRAELWSTAGWFDDRLRFVDWDVVVHYEPISRQYQAVRVVNDTGTMLGTFSQYADVIAAVERAYRPAIRATPNRSSQYYNVILTLEMPSGSDLDELQRWVSGDLSPAVRGQRNPGTALSRGARTLLSRLIGGERRTLQARGRTFRLQN